jgi:hypothetical protein
MSLRNRLVLPIILSSLAVLAGCGSSTNKVVPPPSGAFSNTDLNGTYTFSVAGSDVNGPMSIAGSFTACGCSAGTISGGAVDFDDPALPNAFNSAVGTNSTYSITADGRGTASLFITPSGLTPFEVVFDFVLTSSSHGLIIRYDKTGTGSGTIDLQSSAVSQGSIENTPYVFTFSGSDLSDDLLSTVGTFTLNSSGTITAGVNDCNFNAEPFYQAALSGSVLVGSGTAPGSASILTGCSSGALTFDVYTIDSTHLKLIESDGAAFLVGDAFAQTSATIPQGGLVFTMAGLDSLSSSGAPFVSGGTVVSDGASQLTGGLEDVNDDTTIDGGVTPAVPLNFGGTFVASPSGSGRFQLALSNFFGAPILPPILPVAGFFWCRSTRELAQESPAAWLFPRLRAQAIAATQGYGLNNQGVDFNTGSELDEIAQFTTTSTGMTGLLDDNDGGSVNTSNVNGTYTAADSNGAGTATIGSRLQSINYYAADSSTVLFISTDPNQIAAGVFEAQSAPGGDNESPAVRPRALPMFRALPRFAQGCGA